MSRLVHDEHGKPTQSGAILVAVTISLAAAAAMVGALHVLTGSSGALSGAISRRASLQSFADGVLGVCPTVVDAANATGDFTGQTLASAIQNTPGFTFTIDDVSFSSELADLNQWADYNLGIYEPDMTVVSGEFTGQLDVDLITTKVRDSGLIDAEFGARSVGSTSRTFGYRCMVVANDAFGRRAMAYGILIR